MRCKDINVTLSIPVPIGEHDGNGVVYTEEAIVQACKNCNGQPIIQFNEKGEEIVIGYAKNVEYLNGFIFVDAVSWHGGTCDLVDKLLDKTVTEFRISSFGLCE